MKNFTVFIFFFLKFFFILCFKKLILSLFIKKNTYDLGEIRSKDNFVFINVIVGY